MKRIYLVKDVQSQELFLVKAPTQATAIRAIVTLRYSAHVATQDELISLIQMGTKVQEG